MAQQTKGRSGGGSNAKGRSSGSSSAKRKSSASSNGRSSTRRKTSPSVKGASRATASRATNAVTAAAKKFKTPAIAAGAGLAGVAGGIALTRGKDRKVLGVSLPNRGTARATSKNLTDAAKNVGAFAGRTAQVAERVRVVSEAIGENGARRKSPIEVVLEGLTSRSQRGSG
jgi:hypothetical protein